MKYFQRYKKDEQIEYLNYLINVMDGMIHNQYKNNGINLKLLNKLDIRKELREIENDLVFSEKETISYFTKRKITKIAKVIDLLK